ncbi:MAG: YqcC family protein [Gammaproteobacteria bacterium]|nr:YqcC family protein [Gammaproteobacteria bacterium]
MGLTLLGGDLDMDNRREVARILAEIEAELRQAHLWENHPPRGSALASTLPFCFDTLAFTQWLQWVLLPKMTAIMEKGLALPADSRIAPMAEECLSGLSVPPDRLMGLLRRLDALLSDSRPG